MILKPFCIKLQVWFLILQSWKFLTWVSIGTDLPLKPASSGTYGSAVFDTSSLASFAIYRGCHLGSIFKRFPSTHKLKRCPKLVQPLVYKSSNSRKDTFLCNCHFYQLFFSFIWVIHFNCVSKQKSSYSKHASVRLRMSYWGNSESYIQIKRFSLTCLISILCLLIFLLI